MTTKVAALLATVGQAITAIGLIFLTTKDAPFGWNPHDLGVVLGWIGEGITAAVIAIRVNLIPGITTGIGTEITTDAKTGAVISAPPSGGG